VGPTSGLGVLGGPELGVGAGDQRGFGFGGTGLRGPVRGVSGRGGQGSRGGVLTGRLLGGQPRGLRLARGGLRRHHARG